MTVSETARPGTSAAGHLAITDELREQIRKRLLAMLDVTERRLNRSSAEEDDLSNDLDLLNTVEAVRSALAKLDVGRYGVCESCQGPIPFERLDAVPNARNCVACETRTRALVR
jgi:RNA polymerase-binding transcription factor DksA